MQALAALAHAHSMGVVHRDLKPANMMITETGAVKIMDFGIARVAGTEHLTNAGFMMGTPAYMAPEQVRGEELDARADLYSMGVVFYRLTTAKLPFKGETPFAMAQSQVNDPPTPVGMVRSDLPPWVEPVVARSLAKRPEERFQSAAEFHEAFARCLAGLPFTTMYGANAQTELLMTPSRAMPTGSLSMRGFGTGSLPTVLGAEPGAFRPATDPGAGLSSGAVVSGPVFRSCRSERGTRNCPRHRAGRCAGGRAIDAIADRRTGTGGRCGRRGAESRRSRRRARNQIRTRKTRPFSSAPRSAWC